MPELARNGGSNEPRGTTFVESCRPLGVSSQKLAVPAAGRSRLNRNDARKRNAGFKLDRPRNCERCVASTHAEVERRLSRRDQAAKLSPSVSQRLTQQKAR